MNEKGMLYCKLTVGFRGLNLQLHVSFGAVESWCRCALKKAFLFRFALHARKKMPLSRIKKFSLAETLRTSLKAVFYAQKLLLLMPFFAVRKKFPFSQTKKSFFCTNPSLIAIQSNSFPPSAAHFNAP